MPVPFVFSHYFIQHIGIAGYLLKYKAVARLVLLKIVTFQHNVVLQNGKKAKEPRHRRVRGLFILNFFERRDVLSCN